jgi:hypothetical protein
MSFFDFVGVNVACPRLKFMLKIEATTIVLFISCVVRTTFVVNKI